MGSWDNGRHASPDPQTHSDNYIECACALSNLLEAVAIVPQRETILSELNNRAQFYTVTDSSPCWSVYIRCGEEGENY